MNCIVVRGKDMDERIKLAGTLLALMAITTGSGYMIADVTHDDNPTYFGRVGDWSYDYTNENYTVRIYNVEINDYTISFYNHDNDITLVEGQYYSFWIGPNGYLENYKCAGAS